MRMNCYLYCLTERSRGCRSLWRLDDPPGDLCARHGHGLYFYQGLLMRPRHFIRVNCYLYCLAERSKGYRSLWRLDDPPGDLRASHGPGLYFHQRLLMSPLLYAQELLPVLPG